MRQEYNIRRSIILGTKVSDADRPLQTNLGYWAITGCRRNQALHEKAGTIPFFTTCPGAIWPPEREPLKLFRSLPFNPHRPGLHLWLVWLPTRLLPMSACAGWPAPTHPCPHLARSLVEICGMKQ